MGWGRPVGGGKRDLAEAPIVAALRARGAEVTQLSGKGCPDLLVRYQGMWLPLEVKTGKGRKTPLQQGITWPIVRTPEEALAAIGAVK